MKQNEIEVVEGIKLPVTDSKETVTAEHAQMKVDTNETYTLSAEDRIVHMAKEHILSDQYANACAKHWDKMMFFACMNRFSKLTLTILRLQGELDNAVESGDVEENKLRKHRKKLNSFMRDVEMAKAYSLTPANYVNKILVPLKVSEDALMAYLRNEESAIHKVISGAFDIAEEAMEQAIELVKEETTRQGIEYVPADA